MKNTVRLLLFGVAVIIAGCSTIPKSDLSTLEGMWKGRIPQGDHEHRCSLMVSGSNYEFHDTEDTNVWYKGTFSLREDTTPRQFIALVTECPFPQYVGKTSLAIYRLEAGKLALTGNEPGKPESPRTFDAPDAARLEAKRD
jgi:uncharacterized protein (TIGR03067 family)